jgi:hypothetical protein
MKQGVYLLIWGGFSAGDKSYESCTLENIQIAYPKGSTHEIYYIECGNQFLIDQPENNNIRVSLYNPHMYLFAIGLLFFSMIGFLMYFGGIKFTIV